MDAKLQELVQPDCDIASVSFSGIKLGPEGAQAVASVLKVASNGSRFYRATTQTYTCHTHTHITTTCVFMTKEHAHTHQVMSNNTQQVCTSLREVNLSHCAVGGRGAIALAQALTQDTCIQKLALAGNGLGAEGGTAIALMLKYNKGLEHVNLLYNGLGAHVGLTLVDALRANTTLRKLQVMYDGLSTEGGNALADMLVHNSTLEELEVGGSAEDLTGEGRAALDAAIAGNPTLRKLKFFDDPSFYFVRG